MTRPFGIGQHRESYRTIGKKAIEQPMVLDDCNFKFVSLSTRLMCDEDPYANGGESCAQYP